LVTPKDETAGMKAQLFVWGGKAFTSFVDGFAAVIARVILGSGCFNGIRGRRMKKR